MSRFWREMSLCAKGRMTHILSLFCHLWFPLHWASLSHTQTVFQAISESAKSRIGPLCPSSSSGHPSGLCDPRAIVLAACLLADTSNNPEIWPPSNLITAPATIDPAPRGFPSGDTSLSLSLLTQSLSLSFYSSPSASFFTCYYSLCLSQFFFRVISRFLLLFLLTFSFRERWLSVGTPVLIPSSLWLCLWHP